MYIQYQSMLYDDSNRERQLKSLLLFTATTDKATSNKLNNTLEEEFNYFVNTKIFTIYETFYYPNIS